MSAGAVVMVVLFSVVLIVAVIVIYLLAKRVKGGLDTSPVPFMAVAPVAVRLSTAGAASLEHLSQDPILLKQSPDGVRVQLDDRPMVPLVILTDRGAASALREIVARASQEYGAQWTVLVTQPEDGGSSAEGAVTMQRLA
jgi:hypothetical protein